MVKKKIVDEYVSDAESEAIHEAEESSSDEEMIIDEKSSDEEELSENDTKPVSKRATPKRVIKKRESHPGSEKTPREKSIATITSLSADGLKLRAFIIEELKENQLYEYEETHVFEPELIEDKDRIGCVFSFCDSSFTSKGGLQYHIQHVHHDAAKLFKNSTDEIKLLLGSVPADQFPIMIDEFDLSWEGKMYANSVLFSNSLCARATVGEVMERGVRPTFAVKINMKSMPTVHHYRDHAPNYADIDDYEQYQSCVFEKCQDPYVFY